MFSFSVSFLSCSIISSFSVYYDLDLTSLASFYIWDLTFLSGFRPLFVPFLPLFSTLDLPPSNLKSGDKNLITQRVALAHFLYDKFYHTLLGPCRETCDSVAPTATTAAIFALIHLSVRLRSVSCCHRYVLSSQRTDMRRLTTEIRSEKCVVVRTSYSVLTQTQTVQYSLLHT